MSGQLHLTNRLAKYMPTSIRSFTLNQNGRQLCMDTVWAHCDSSNVLKALDGCLTCVGIDACMCVLPHGGGWGLVWGVRRLQNMGCSCTQRSSISCLVMWDPATETKKCTAFEKNGKYKNKYAIYTKLINMCSTWELLHTMLSHYMICLSNVSLKSV